jgi:hemophore-related protein
VSSNTGRIGSPGWMPDLTVADFARRIPHSYGRDTSVMTFSKQLAAGFGAFVLSLAAGSGIASADPVDSIVNTSCSYPQVVSALNAENPGAAAQFNSSPVAQGYLSRFLAAGPDKRRQMAAQVQGIPQAQQYFGLIEQVANTCNNF